MIELTMEQRTWLNAHIESGDLAWAKPYVDEARSAVARGDVITLAEHRVRNEARLSALLK